MFCNQCGQKFDGDAKFFPSCGNKFSDSASQKITPIGNRFSKAASSKELSFIQETFMQGNIASVRD